MAVGEHEGSSGVREDRLTLADAIAAAVIVLAVMLVLKFPVAWWLQ
jgi:hypothetical protein